MAYSHVIQVVAKGRLASEKKLGEEFNAWMKDHPKAKVIHFFEPVRHDRTFGDYNYNEYHTSLTFFYEEPLPCGLKELPKVGK